MCIYCHCPCLVAELKQLYAEDKFTDLLAQVQAYLPKDAAGNFIAGQEKSDVVHDLLAFFAERMLEMNKQKQQEIRGFLGWLEGYVGAKVEDLTPKTKLQGYYEHDYESFLATLKKNRKKLAVDPARREPWPRAGFEGYDWQTGTALGEDRENGQADRRLYGCTGSQKRRSGSWRGSSPSKQFHE